MYYDISGENDEFVWSYTINETTRLETYTMKSKAIKCIKCVTNK